MNPCSKHDDRIVVHFMRSFFGKRKYFFTDDWLFFSKRFDVVFGSDRNQFDFSPLIRVSDCLLMIVL